MSSLLIAQNRAAVNNKNNGNAIKYTLLNRTEQKAKDLSLKLSHLQTTTLKVEDLFRTDLSHFNAIFLGIKPTQLKDLINQHPNLQTFKGEVISTLAGVTMSTLISVFAKASIYSRLMPSITVAEAQSTALFYSTASTTTSASSMLLTWYQNSLGNLLPVASDEEIDRLTLIFGSNAAYMATLIQPWMDFLAKNLNNELKSSDPSLDVQSTMIDQYIVALNFLKNKNLAEVITQVKTPGGITAQALLTLDQHKYAEIIKQALDASSNRSQEVGEQVSRDLNSSSHPQ